MKETQPIFPIENTIVSAVQDVREKTNPRIRAEYLAGIGENEHPELLSYLKKTVVAAPAEQVYGYANGFSMMYDIMLRQQSSDTHVELTQEDMLVHDYNVQENGIDRLSAGAIDYWHTHSLPEDSTNEPTPITIFMERLESSSWPIYADVQKTLGRKDVDPNEKLGYFRGLYDVFMPFYNKAEAGYLQDHLITYPLLKRAVESGFYHEE